MTKHYCIHQRDIHSSNNDDRLICTHTENNHDRTYTCPFLVSDHAEYICKLYAPIPKELTVDEMFKQISTRLDKLEYKTDKLMLRFKHLLKKEYDD